MLYIRYILYIIIIIIYPMQRNSPSFLVTLVWLAGSGMQLHKYKYQPAADTIAHFTLDAIKKFADDCLQLKLEPFFKSSIAPAKLQLFEKKKKAMHEQGLGYARYRSALAIPIRPSKHCHGSQHRRNVSALFVSGNGMRRVFIRK